MVRRSDRFSRERNWKKLWGTGGVRYSFLRCYYSVNNADKRKGNNINCDKQGIAQANKDLSNPPV